MRTRAAIASILASTAVLIGGWELGTAGTTASAPTADSASATAPGTAAPPTASGSANASTPATPSAAATPSESASTSAVPAVSSDGTFTGTSESTRYGNVQVQITVSNGAITDVTALHLTDKDGRSISISNRAAPILRSEILAAQSANVQSVSGATYTSDAYLSSLQSAIDQAGL